MSFDLYKKLAPAEVERTIPSLVRNDKARKIGLPVLFFSSDRKLLLTGNLERGKLNLPSTSHIVRDPRRHVDLESRVRDFGDFVFFDARAIQTVSFTGLLRQKHDESAVVVPFTVAIGDHSSSPYLSPSDSWQQNAVGNPDRVWACQDKVQDVLRDGLLSDNAATIVRFATQQTGF